MGSHSCCEFMDAAVLACPDDIISFLSSSTTESYVSSPSSRDSLGGVYDIDVPFVT